MENNAAAMMEGEKKMAFAEFIKQDGAYKCTVTQNVEGTSTQGTTYINNGMVRGEFKTEVKGMSVDSNMIVRDGYTYAWSSAAPTMGFKAKVMMDSTNADAFASGSYSWNAEQIGDYNCEVWTADEAKFVLPKGVTFKEMTAATMMPKDAM